MNINKITRNKILSSSYIYYGLISTLVVVVLCFSISSNNEILGIEDKQKNNLENILQQNATLAFGKNHFSAVGDWYCNKETEKTIENILAIDPEVIITTGDHVKDEKSAKCWIEMSEKIKDKMKIAIGNHDRDSSIIYKQITRNHNLTTPYYSHDFKNIHFISLSTEHPFEEGSKQHEFIISDLEKTSKNQI
jgi:Calcineurin-like phosphoesterase